MPTYVYRCKKCKHRFELFHSITDESVKRCPRCNGKAERVPAAGAGIIFKGSGFYITDYRSRSYKDKARQESGAGSKEAGGSSSAGGGGSSSSGGDAGSSSGGASSRKSRKSGGSSSGRSGSSSSGPSGGSSSGSPGGS